MKVFFQAKIIATVTLFVVNLSAILLFLIEKTSAVSSIDSLADAYWCTVSVIVTRSYGDLYPVTLYGRIVGYFLFIFSLLLSLMVIAGIINKGMYLKKRRFLRS